jgi:D-alanine-D-alanine ligase
MAGRKVRVGLIFGGRSGEHEVSLMSARSVMRAIDKDKYEVIPIGITKGGKWIAGGDPLKALAGETAAGTTEAALLSDPGHRALMEVRPAGETGVTLSSLAEVDVMFPLLHGTFGEDGTVQGLLELANIPYVGAGVVGSAVGMDKAVFKAVMRANDIPVVDFVLYLRSEVEADTEGSRLARRAEAALRYPMFCKPANLGSSVGVSKAHRRAELLAGLREAARWDRRVMVEQGVDAREIEVSVLGNDAPVASVPGEIVPSREFYDYNAKYIDEGSQLVVPAPLPAETAERVRDLAVRAFRAVDCAGMARVDFLLDKESGEVFVSELNTIPGFTNISMYPKLWEASGLSYSDLIGRLIDLALERQADKDRTERSYEAGP